MIVFPYLCGLIELPNFASFLSRQSMLYDPYSQPAIDIDQLADECKAAVTSMQDMHTAEMQDPVWDCAAGGWLVPKPTAHL
jgi:hypothetical protein